MAYRCNVALTIPAARFPKFYRSPFDYRTPVAVERAPLINADITSQVSYLRWIANEGDVVDGHREHIAEVVDLFSNLPFDVSCVKCGNDVASRIILSYQKTHEGYIDVSYSNFPFYCPRCSVHVGGRKLELPINFDTPLARMPNTRIGRRELLRDLKRMLYFGFEDGPHEFLDTQDIAKRARDSGVAKMNIDNRRAKEIVNIMHYLRKTTRQRRIHREPDLFDIQPTFTPASEYKERSIFTVTRRGANHDARTPLLDVKILNP
jgi:hypothetical protein